MKLQVNSHRRDRTPGRIRKRNETLILQAAEAEFSRCGFKGASIREIARKAGLPKANIHYYFNNKLTLYIALLSDIIDLWDSTLSDISAEDDPAKVLSDYIRRKMQYSKLHPHASRIFASEVISGAPNIQEFFGEDYHRWFDQRASVIKQWAVQGKMDPVSPHHLIFLIWSATQHYADFSVQVNAALNKQQLSDDDFEIATATLISIILKGCGIKRVQE